MNIKKISRYDNEHTAYYISCDKIEKILDYNPSGDYYFEQCIDWLLRPFETDKDFFRKYNFQNYNLRHSQIGGDLYLGDYTDDIISSYLEYKFDINSSVSKKSNDSEYYKLGKLEFKNNDLFFNDERLDISPQGLVIMKKFMAENISGSKYFIYDDICDVISSKRQISIESMQKLISKLRKEINSKTKDFSIKSKSNTGYIFTLKNIH